MNDWLLIILMSFFTFVPRYLPFLFAGRIKIPQLIENSLNFVPIAVLTSIITQSSLIRDGELSIEFSNYYLYAALISFLISRITNNLFLVVSIGMSIFYILKWIF